MKDKILKFIKENELTFTGRGSGLNSSCTIICGYADYVGANQKVVEEAIKEHLGESRTSSDLRRELNKVYNFAATYNYGKWWTSEEAIRTYRF